MAPSPRPTTALALPPAFSLIVNDGPEAAFAQALRLAGPDAAGALVWSRRADLVDLAVILQPDEPLRTARRAFFACLTAFADALGGHAPPDIPLTFVWPGEIRFDGARLGGARLGWPDGCGEGESPDWLAFSATLIAAKAGDPGLTPDSTSLSGERFELEDHGALIESFARHLTRAFATWEEDGFEGIGRRYLARLGGGGRLDGDGDLVTDGGARMALAPALSAPDWLDSRTGAPRL